MGNEDTPETNQPPQQGVEVANEEDTTDHAVDEVNADNDEENDLETADDIFEENIIWINRSEKSDGRNDDDDDNVGENHRTIFDQ